MPRPVHYPSGCWPLEMRAETAAGYCDEPSVETFLAKVERGIYPAACREKGSSLKWHRHKLDEMIARRHGLMFSAGALVEDAAELIG